ncbi:MAG: hypothetical protein K2G97_00850, partial [Oscillospiraceae bacterium]|nr:hypothetical protein [Oscillospiraceae bacterium]
MGKISNINFKNGKLINGNYYIGGFVGTNKEGGVIDNCSVNMNNENVSIGAGFVYKNNGKITNSDTTSSAILGGFVGENENGIITNCIATGDVRSGSGGSHVGGFVGSNKGGTITECNATGDARCGGGGSYIGGFVGSNESGTIKNCSATGNVYGGGGGSYVGEFVGYNSGTITNNLTKKFTISSKDDFSIFMTTSEYLEINCRVNLTCDIDMQGEVFDYIETFSGRFEGGNHTISNLSFKCFVKTNNGKISNIKFNGGKLINDNIIRGGFVVTNEEGGTIDNCVIDMNSEDASINAGFVWINSGKITNSETTLSVKNDNGYSGGFAGCNNNGTMTNCSATGTVTGSC